MPVVSFAKSSWEKTFGDDCPMAGWTAAAFVRAENEGKDSDGRELQHREVPAKFLTTRFIVEICFRIHGLVEEPTSSLRVDCENFEDYRTTRR